MSERSAAILTAVAGGGAFMLVAFAVAGLLDLALVPEPIGLVAEDDLASYRRLRGFTAVVAGFAGSIAAGFVGHRLAQRYGLEVTERAAAILAGPVLLGLAWLWSVDPSWAALAAGLVLFALGAGLAPTLAAVRGRERSTQAPAPEGGAGS